MTAIILTGLEDSELKTSNNVYWVLLAGLNLLVVGPIKLYVLTLELPAPASPTWYTLISTLNTNSEFYWPTIYDAFIKAIVAFGSIKMAEKISENCLMFLVRHKVLSVVWD